MKRNDSRNNMHLYRENRKFIKSWLLHLLTIICIHSDNVKIGEWTALCILDLHHEQQRFSIKENTMETELLIFYFKSKIWISTRVLSSGVGGWNDSHAHDLPHAREMSEMYHLRLNVKRWGDLIHWLQLKIYATLDEHRQMQRALMRWKCIWCHNQRGNKILIFI